MIEEILQDRKLSSEAADTFDDSVSAINMAERLLRGFEIKQRVIFCLHLAGLNRREIGEQVGYSESRISQILKSIRSILKQKWHELEEKQ